MAVKNFTITREEQGKVWLVKWVLANGDSGRPIVAWNYSDISVQVYGTFGTGGSVQPEGSNDIDTATATFFTLRDPGGLPIAFTSAGGKQILEHTYIIRPRCTAGDGTTAITVIMCLSSTRG
jgi:hypothetical protein